MSYILYIVDFSFFFLQIRVRPLSGDPDLYLSFTHPVQQGVGYDIREYRIGGDQITLCPGDYPSPDAQIYFSVFTFRAVTAYDIEVVSVPVPLNLSRTGWVKDKYKSGSPERGRTRI